MRQVETDSRNTSDEIRNQLSQVETDSRNTSDELRSQMRQTEVALNGEIAKRDSSIEELNKIITNLRYTTTMLERRVVKILENAEKPSPDTASAREMTGIIKEKDHLLDALYVSFEDQFRGTREDIKERSEVYLPYIKEVNTGTNDSTVLDIGCGRGEWLELLKEKGLEARGVDINSVLISQCRERKLDVIENDVILYLRTLPDSSIGAVTGFHIIEHLPFETLIKLLDETTRVLKEGGIAIFETPNPQNVLVGSCNFYLDPTHRNPLPSSMMKFMVEARGLCKVEIVNLHPCNEENRLSGSDLAERFNKYFYGPQDYAVIGYKK
jgi:O-antigen chain-terminating methyltransferase